MADQENFFTANISPRNSEPNEQTMTIQQERDAEGSVDSDALPSRRDGWQPKDFEESQNIYSKIFVKKEYTLPGMVCEE